jgi:hypothetical protein
MTEQVPPMVLDEGPEGVEQSAPQGDVPAERTTTGVPAVDRVLADVDQIDDLPLEEHLGAFERAHDSLRSALDARPSDTPSHQPGDPA